MPHDEPTPPRRPAPLASTLDLWRRAGMEPDDPDDQREIVDLLRFLVDWRRRMKGRGSWWSKIVLILITAVTGVLATLGARWIP